MDYRTAFHEYLKAQGVKGDMPAEARAVLDRGFTSVEHRAQTTTAAAGGYTIPTELLNVLTQSMLAFGPMYNPGITTEIVTAGGGAITMPTVNDTASVVVKHTEGATLTDDGGSDVTFGEKALNAYAFNTEWIRVSKELADDSVFAMETILGNLLGERLGRRANLELTVGDGTGDPNGIVTASGAGLVAAATAAITADEIITFLHSVDPAYRTGPKVGFMFNDGTLSAIRKLKDGDGNYLWQMGDIRNGEPATILGHAYSINQAMADLGASAKPIIFGDFGRYVVRKVRDFSVLTLRERYAENFQVGMIGFKRFDGELLNASAVKALVNAES
jgi:HK97 family phage major capsid protein